VTLDTTFLPFLCQNDIRTLPGKHKSQTIFSGSNTYIMSGIINIYRVFEKPGSSWNCDYLYYFCLQVENVKSNVTKNKKIVGTRGV
jgi:hypothetical protein